MDVTVAVLAGGLGRRIGGDKAMVELGGRPLIAYALEAARDAGLPAVVVAKPTTRLPPLEVPILLEPPTPHHPLLGIITALEHHPTVVALPCDMPLLRPVDLAALAAMPGDVARLWPGEPLPSLYRRGLLPQLREALGANRSVRSTQAQSDLAPAAASSIDSASQIRVNTPEDVARVEALLRRR
jgi:molybdopterin-guanine dinucleotide biosynthesis protein A